MTTIELNDSEIRVARGTDIILREPGYAVLKPDRIDVGTEAWKIARCNPRATCNHYWSQLSQDSLIVPSRLARHNADLAYVQLLAIHEQAGKPEQVLFAVPGSYTRDQLSLLLGITEACPFTALGLVDAATACAAAIADAGEYSHVDIHLHYAVISTLEVSDKVSRTSVKIVDNSGITDIYDTCAGYLSDLFIDQSRFDPLHHAETEQYLYDRIPECFQTLKESDEVTLEIQFKDKRYQARVFKEPLLEELKKHYEKIYREIAGPAVLISDRLDRLPGFAGGIENAVPVDEQAVFRGCNVNLENIRSAGPALSFVTTLPATQSPVISAGNPSMVQKKTGPSENGTAPAATHVLINNRAYTLDKTPLYLSTSGQASRKRDKNMHCSARLAERGVELKPEVDLTMFVNGNRISGSATVMPGDTVTFDGSDTVVRFIEVIEH